MSSPGPRILDLVLATIQSKGKVADHLGLTVNRASNALSAWEMTFVPSGKGKPARIYRLKRSN